MRIIEHDDGLIVAVAGWDIKVVVDALRVAVLDAVTPKLRLQPCVCGSVEHQVADCLERPARRLRPV
ncbi:hypothetical protein JHN59_04015 [Streptomyces sp. MBT49]|uniref:hypothetical protein n=1 Tax=Streptomyces sp. MBT49 TaxID=1488380 RepID=UPI00190A0E7D|nr:hypothetical protein [Streptomyces sp. MBT49]MBK3624015.1 hypothetical protein [Streptomyces sp. MBT49]